MYKIHSITLEPTLNGINSDGSRFLNNLAKYRDRPRNKKIIVLN